MRNSQGLQLPLFTPDTKGFSNPTFRNLPHDWTRYKRIGLDLETRDEGLNNGLGPGHFRDDSYVVGFCIAFEDGPRFYLPIRHAGGDNMDEIKVLRYVRDNAARYKGDIVGANISYDLGFLSKENIELPHARIMDVQVAAVLIYELYRSYSLASIAERLQLPPKDETLLREAAEQYGLDPKKDLWRFPARYAADYGAWDAELPLKVMRRLEHSIEEKGLWDIFRLECQVTKVIHRMRMRGVRIDLDKLKEVEQYSLKQEKDALQSIKHTTGVDIPIGGVWKAGPLAEALEKIGVTVPRTPKTRKPSVSKELLTAVEREHELGKTILWARKVNKLRTTFASSIRKYLVNGRIHCGFNQMAREDDTGVVKGARFGRMSSEHPNIQQQPSRDEFASMWRSIYVPDEEGIWACNDYCFSNDTEVLTENGFKLFRDLQSNEGIAQYREGRIEFANPLDYQRISFKGKMVHVKGDRQVDLLMTPNHNCLLQRQNGKEFTIKADEYRNIYGFQLNAALFQGFAKENMNLLRVVAAIQADGSERIGNYRIWLKKDRKVQRLREILEDSGLNYHETYCANKPAGHGFVIDKCPSISKYLEDEKLFRRDALLRLIPEQRLQFLDELKLWDGSVKKSYYCSTVRHNVEVAQEIAVLTGRRSNMKSRPLPSGKTLWSVALHNQYRTETKGLTTTDVPYDGFVYCVTMPWSTVVVRRNGRVCITKQSQQEPRILTHFAYLARCPGAFEAIRRYRDDPLVDNHQMMAELTGLPRKRAKDIYLGLCYSMGGAKLAESLGLPTKFITTRSGRKIKVAGDKAQGILDTFNQRAPFIKAVARQCEETARSRGYIRTLLGRHCHFPQDSAGNYDWTHKALNRLIQGSAADQTKKAMVECDRAGFALQLQVHDELDLTVESVKEAQGMAEIMRDCVRLELPMRVDVETGPSWGEIK